MLQRLVLDLPACFPKARMSSGLPPQLAICEFCLQCWVTKGTCGSLLHSAPGEGRGPFVE